MITFQDVLIRLQTYWAEYGCAIWQPHNVQVGAGTMNPATYLRVLGPEPWNVAYVEPSVRPDDGRYGDNPNRMQYYYQYQVILKPDPGNPQEIYLKSLDAIGINRDEHDIRFVEDNWESPALGAWGLGWEVWLDGLEITQFTYFQQAGGMELSPKAVEITYGVERIVAALQGVDSVWDIQFNDSMTYGDIYLQSEWENSTYYFEHADEQKLTETFNTYEAEAIRCLDNEPPLVMPAHDYVLKCSHLFNVLDTRGAIGIVERADYFKRMQRLAARVARSFAEQRAEAGFPLVPNGWELDEDTHAALLPKPAAPATDGKPTPDGVANLVFEIGVEELPAADVDMALAQLNELVPTLLDESRLSYGKVHIGGTPRRLVVHVVGVAPKQEAMEFVRRGPPVSRAYDEDGNPTKAAEGFARGQGVGVDDLEQQEIDGGHYVIARIMDEGKAAVDVFAELLPQLVADLRFGRSMKWNSSGVAFSRPIRWYVALLGEAVLPFEYAYIYSGRTTRGTRAADSPEIEVADADDYFNVVGTQGIILDHDTRRKTIREAVEAIAKKAGGQIADDPGLLDEVTNIVEQPTAMLGRFDEDYLDLPDIALTTVMRKHQRYFAVVDDDGNLMPMFIAVRNGGEEHLDKVVHGNEQVIRARFSDARFFFNEDIKKPLETYLDGLSTLTFQEDLGSYKEKAARIEGLSGRIASSLGLSDDDASKAVRAARLAKADLTTQMVVEMTSLQGAMGRIYALRDGEDPAVAQAIAEHYLPTAAGGAVPESMLGTAVALADRFDSLVGLFSVGLQPTGTSDPYALRRAALGIVQIALEKELDLSLTALIDWAAEGYAGSHDISDEVKTIVYEFILDRMRVLFRDTFRYDVSEAVLNEAGDNPTRAWRHAEQLTAWLERDEWEYTLEQFARCVRITRNQETQYQVEEDTFEEDIEGRLFAAVEKMEEKRGNNPDVDDLLTALQPVLPVIETFFAPPDEGGVLVMADEEAVRHNRLGMLQRIARSANGVADFSQMEGF